MRSLAITALSFSAAVFAACYWLPYDVLPLLAAIVCGLGILLFAPRRRWLRGTVLALLACGVGLGWFWLHGQTTAVPAARLDGETRTIRALVTDYPLNTDSYSRVTVRLETEGLPRLNALLYDNSRSLSDTQPGERLELEARLRSADTRYGEKDGTYNAQDVYLIANARGEILRTPGPLPLSKYPLRLNRLLSGLVRELFPEDTVAFFQALTLGDRSELYKDKTLQMALSRAGLMHITAVSGMHIVFLVGLVQAIFGKNRRSAVMALALMWLFVLATGAGPSAVRAGLMQTLLLLAPLLRRENDTVTSLSFALAFILLLNPYAAASVGLQLSFASLTGILCFSDRLSEGIYGRLPALRRSRLGRGAVGALVNSLSVMPFTMPLMGLHFGYVSLLAPLANVLAYTPVTVCFCGAYVICGVGLLSPVLGTWLGWILAWLARYVILAARFVSVLPAAAVYLNRNETAVWAILAYLLFLGFQLLPLCRSLRLAFPALLTMLALGVVMLTARLDYEKGPGTVAVLDVGQGQCICVLQGGATMMIDCGGLGTLNNAGETAGAYLLSRGRGQVDVLLLTHLDSDHCNGVETLLALCPVNRLLLPANAFDENGMLELISAAAEKQGTELVFLDEDAALTLERIYVEIYAPPAGAEGNDGCLSCVVSLGAYDMLVTGDLSQRAETQLLDRRPVSDLELYIVGHHGSKYASSERLLESIGADTAVVSCGYNSYGHPAPETLERLESFGYTVYRTDTDGTIEIRIGKNYGEKEQLS